MGRPPAYVFIVRHGNRLDAADKQWHLSSPTPYDPPLTYSGWQQAKALGARIGSIIRDKVLEDENAARLEQASGAQRRRKKYKIVLHSSPFLRCIQTAIAISAGIAQDPTPLATTFPVSNKPPASNLASNSAYSPHIRPSIVTDVRGAESGSPPRTSKPSIQKSVLRLDAFLGEWLSPGYFEHITPPPESVMMLASAKADLLRREDYSNYPNFATHLHSNSQGQLWGASVTGGASPDGLEDMSGMANTLPRSGSMSSQDSAASWRASLSQPPSPGGYVAPVPSYAISSNAPIPMGYVAHARDACVNIDYQWDSMRAPLDWGNGGSFGEEWTAMHSRFRKGIQRLVDWYSSADAPTDMVTKTAARWAKRDPVEDSGCAMEDAGDVDTEAVVILVSHGAGCNALIGALTHQPVLTDVAMTSLTMAVRKPGAELPVKDTSAGCKEEQATVDMPQASTPIHHIYDIKLFANIDHLRSTASTPRSSRSPSAASAMANGLSATRGRFSNTISSALSNFSYADSSGNRPPSANGTLSGFRVQNGGGCAPSRSSFSATNGTGGGITVGSGITSFTSIKPSGLSRRPSVGLWSPISVHDNDGADDDDDADMLLNFSHEKFESAKDGASSSTALGAMKPVAATAATPPSPSLPTLESQTPSHAPVSVAPDKPALSSPVDGRALDKDPLTDVLSLPTGFTDSGKADALSPLGLGIDYGGLWKGDTLHDLNSTKRQWAVTERT